MSALKICRICLNTDTKLYKYDRYYLKNYYEQVTGSNVYETDGLPQYFCYECAALLHKFHKFKEKCNSGQNLLKELLQKGPIRLKSVRDIRRQITYFQSSLNIITVSRRVKTSVVKSKENPKLDQTESTEIDLKTMSISDSDDYIEADNEEELSPVPELANIDTQTDDRWYEEKINIKDENIDVDNEKLSPIHENIDIVHEDMNIEEEKPIIDKEEEQPIIDEEEIEVTEDVLKLEREFSDDNKLKSDDENVEDIKIPTDNEKLIEKESLLVTTKKKNSAKGNDNKNKGNDAKTSKKRKKFEITGKKKTELDPKNWLKFNLSEEEALEEFKARAQQERYISSKYKCDDCLKGFSKEDILDRHRKLRHSESLGPMECRFCHMRFKIKCLLTRHMREHFSKFKCLRCELVCPLETTALFHEDYHNGIIRKCEHCDQEFKHISTYYTHLRTHRSEHVCALCGTSFVSAAGLRMHKKIKHIEDKETEGRAPSEEEYCIRCDIKFESKMAFEEHLMHSAKHVDGIEYELCLKRTQIPQTEVSMLDETFAQHTHRTMAVISDVEVPATSNRSARKRGTRPQRRLQSIPTDCYVCGKHFATQAACRKHRLTEHPGMSVFAPNERVICEICGISLKPASVPSHLNSHTRETLYTCNTCGKDFTCKVGLNKHKLCHSSAKPVACTLCDKRFKQKDSMKLHYRTFHLKEPYPKRIRKKKFDVGTNLDGYPQEFDDNIPLAKWR